MLEPWGARRAARRSSGRGVLVGSLCSRTGSSLLIQQLEQHFQSGVRQRSKTKIPLINQKEGNGNLDMVLRFPT